jgi:hypothetical protein
MRILFTSRRAMRLLTAAFCAVALSSCASEFTRSSNSPSFLIIDGITAASGADPATFGSFLNSDVITLVQTQIGGQTVRVPTTFNDPGRAQLRLALRNPGTATSPTSPTTINEITVTRFRVTYRRADGRNTPGVDVPYGFDGGVTATVGAGTSAVVGFELVRHLAKEEPPLKNLQYNGGASIIATIAEITFFGRDQAGNEVSVTGSISINFGDFGDPQ